MRRKPMPNSCKRIGSKVSLSDDIMMIPEDHYTQWVNHGIYYRGDWAKEFGITEPLQT